MLSKITQSQAELPIVLHATDAASLRTAIDIASAIGCGVHIEVSGTIAADVVLTPRCPDPDALGVRLRGPATLYGGIFAECEGPDCAWASVEGIRVVSTDGDAFDVSHDGRLAVLGCDAEVDGRFSNVLTAHQNGRILALATSGRSVSSEPSPPLAFIQNSRAIVAGTGEFRTGTADRDFALVVGGGNPESHPVVALIRHQLRCSRDGQFALGFEPGGRGYSKLLWATGRAFCPIELRLGWNESGTIEMFGSGLRMPLPFAIPAWVYGAAYADLEIRD